ncbi:DUF2497 domain-containing protein [Alterisphingorhabdus coralli]|uniref:DUF2497 domain-containing protein n=1 Tax=Alterisphingorhabdus coralli TaxID=3071408 RepID=A0AA97I115_9SPHN|nr:DUF2497 domain-containing protein [Parasphingorhabdus sp. SCSIO 66989]WOE75587.1 DUF2497 domain-containing protein [Parasphingorhabdus sp. SCSIO 66989]
MAQQEPEPSVEDILASIKKVMAEDDAALTKPKRTKKKAAKPQGAEETVLELTETVEEQTDEPLVNPASGEAVRESLAALSTLSEPGKAPQIVRSGETSIEGMVRELLRPMLQQWLDDNLPTMVEELVAKEIARITGKRG